MRSKLCVSGMTGMLMAESNIIATSHLPTHVFSDVGLTCAFIIPLFVLLGLIASAIGVADVFSVQATRLLAGSKAVWWLRELFLHHPRCSNRVNYISNNNNDESVLSK